MRLCFPSAIKRDTVKGGVISHLTIHPQSHLCNTLTVITISQDCGHTILGSKSYKIKNNNNN